MGKDNPLSGKLQKTLYNNLILLVIKNISGKEKKQNDRAAFPCRFHKARAYLVSAMFTGENKSRTSEEGQKSSPRSA